MEKSGCFLSSALVSSLLGGVEEEDKNANRAKENLCLSSFSSYLPLYSSCFCPPFGPPTVDVGRIS